MFFQVTFFIGNNLQFLTLYFSLLFTKKKICGKNTCNYFSRIIGSAGKKD